MSAHQNKDRTSREMHMIFNSKDDRVGDIPFWAVTNTPLEKSPHDLVGYIEMLRRRPPGINWAFHDKLRYAQQEPYRLLCLEYDNVMLKAKQGKARLFQRDFDNVLAKFRGILSVLMLRRTTDTSVS